jgi:hypothetical protein
MTFFEILWNGAPAITLDEAGLRPGRVPYGGRHVRTRERAQEILERFLARCGTHASHMVEAHHPRVVQRERIGHD